MQDKVFIDTNILIYLYDKDGFKKLRAKEILYSEDMQLNSKYAQYFNKRYNRIGPLWQGRFKNSFVYDDSYLSILLKYIEQNPIKAKMTDKIGKYRWSSSSCVINDMFSDLLLGSMLYDKEILDMLNNKISEVKLKKLDELAKTKYKIGESAVRLRKQPLEDYFNNIQDMKKRNKKIKEAVNDGYKQSEVAEYLKLSRTTISKICRKTVDG